MFVFLQSEAVWNNKRDKTKPCKHQSQGGIFVSETDKYIAPFFFDDKVYNLVYWTNIYLFFFFLSFLKLKISMKLEKIWIFILQLNLEKPPPNEKLFFQDANFLPAALTVKD